MNNKCPRCGSKNWCVKNKEYIQHNIVECDVICNFCGYYVDSFSYGAWDSDNPAKPTLCWHNIKLNIKFIFQYVYFRIKRLIMMEE